MPTSPIWFLFFLSDSQRSFTSVWCSQVQYVLSVIAKPQPHFAYQLSPSMYKSNIAPFLPCSHLWLTVFYFTFASHGNCSQVCYSPAFWTCGLACLAGRQAVLLARCVYAGAGHSGHAALQSILEGLFRAAYPCSIRRGRLYVAFSGTAQKRHFLRLLEM